MPDEFVKDTFERPIISLRITITNRCNENCIYCHHDGMVSSKDEMSPDEIYRICKIAKKLGVKKIRLSGGDPLVRKDIVEIVEKIGSLNFKDISLTSNGVLLEKYAKDLKEAGLNRVNISLDSLNRDTYKFVTNMDYLNEAKAGILKSVEVGLYPVKINMVVMNDINENEIKDMFEFCRDNNMVLQLIELIESENCDDDKFSTEYHYKLDLIEEKLADMAEEVIEREFMQGRNANCTRLRVTPDGKIKPCLLRNDNLVDIITYIRNNASDDELKDIFLKGINKREPFNTD